jgi:hypothetical protein
MDPQQVQLLNEAWRISQSRNQTAGESCHSGPLTYFVEDAVATYRMARNPSEWISNRTACARKQTAVVKRPFGMMIRGSSNDL